MMREIMGTKKELKLANQSNSHYMAQILSKKTKWLQCSMITLLYLYYYIWTSLVTIEPITSRKPLHCQFAVGIITELLQNNKELISFPKFQKSPGMMT